LVVLTILKNIMVIQIWKSWLFKFSWFNLGDRNTGLVLLKFGFSTL
jgi:hypothetical protein